MQFDYTIHAENKLERPEVVQMGIDKAKIEKTIKVPAAVDKSELPDISAGRLGTFQSCQCRSSDIYQAKS